LCTVWTPPISVRERLKNIEVELLNLNEINFTRIILLGLMMVLFISISSIAAKAIAKNASSENYQPEIGENPAYYASRASLNRMLDGTAHRPFVNRTLVPQLTNALTFLIPSGMETLLPNPSYSLALRYAILLDTLFLAGWILASRWLIGLFHPATSGQWLDFIGLISLICLWPMLSRHYLYDFSSLFFATLLYGLLYQRRLGWFTFVYTIALFNKETAVLMLIPAVWWLKRYEWPALWLVIFILSRVVLFLAFGKNEGTTLEFHLFEQLGGYLAHPQGSLLIFLATSLLLFRLKSLWVTQADFIRYNFAWLAPIYLILQLLFGMPHEIRVFLELYPLTIILVLKNQLYIPTRGKLCP